MPKVRPSGKSEPQLHAKPRVFLLDDDPVTLDLIGRLLRSASYRVETFGDPYALLSRLSPIDRGCVMVDLRMPAMSGLDVQRALIERRIALPIIFMSGFAEISQVAAAMKQGALDFLPKPVSRTELVAAVAQALAEDAALTTKRQASDDARKRWTRLSPREADVCRQLARGLLHKQIAAELGTVESTVQAQRTRAFKKLAVGTVVELLRLMDQAGEGPEPT